MYCNALEEHRFGELHDFHQKKKKIICTIIITVNKVVIKYDTGKLKYIDEIIIIMALIYLTSPG